MAVIEKKSGIISQIAQCHVCGWSCEDGKAVANARNHARLYDGHMVSVQTVTSATYWRDSK